MDEGTHQLQSFETEEADPVLSNTAAGNPALKPDTWHHVVVRKAGSGDEYKGELYLGTTEGITKVGSYNSNPGGRQMFRIGINRDRNTQYRAERANVAVFRNDTVSIEQLNEAGPFGDVETNEK